MSKTPFGLVFLLWGSGLGAAAQYAKVSVVFDQLPGVYPMLELDLALPCLWLGSSGSCLAW